VSLTLTRASQENNPSLWSIEYVTLDHGSALSEDNVAAAIYGCIFLYLLFISKIEPVGVRLNLTPMGREQLGPYHPLVYYFFIHPRECGHLTTTIYTGKISTDIACLQNSL
jgi:hypothetical protein